MSGMQGPGWYYAQGDPPDTQRYWDGQSWQGPILPADPVPSSDSTGSGTTATKTRNSAKANVYMDYVSTSYPAPKSSRFFASLVDEVLFLLLLYGVPSIIPSLGQNADGSWTAARSVWVYVVVVGFRLFNHLFLVAKTGQSLGKMSMGIRVARPGSGRPPGFGRAFFRLILPPFMFLLDEVWILVDKDNRRLSDKLIGLHVYCN